jgi:hypothetical protein
MLLLGLLLPLLLACAEGHATLGTLKQLVK